MKRKIGFLILLAAVLAAMSCRNNRRDAAYYEQMIDSIRKAEQVKTMQQTAGNVQSPAAAFFDTLRIHTLPIQSSGGADVNVISFSPVPSIVNEFFGYSTDRELFAVSLPPKQHHQVILLADQKELDISSLHLFVMDSHHHPIDILCVREPKKTSVGEDGDETFTEYYVTSNYEITLIQSLKSHETGQSEVVDARRYIINDDGHFEETLIEL